MNIFHWLLIGLNVLGFLITLHKHGKTKTELKYDAVSSFWIGGAVVTLIILSALYK